MTILDKFMNLHDSAIRSNNVDNMLVADKVMRKAIKRLSEYSEEDVRELIEMYDGELNYNNFLTETEAEGVVNKLVSSDGSKGAKWSYDTFFDKVSELGGEIEKIPNYNQWALYATSCMVASDLCSTIEKWTGGDKTKFVQMTYDIAVDKLSDVDKPKFVRWYFGL